jgi:uracil-DNA glycosylase family 4
MAATVPGAQAFLPARRTLPLLRKAARTCEGCDLYLKATRTVFGGGTKTARVALIGEQPGNDEDLYVDGIRGAKGQCRGQSCIFRSHSGVKRSELIAKK